MTKVLAVFTHRPEKVSEILPYSGLDYKVIGKRIRWSRLPSIIRLALLLPAALWTLFNPVSRARLKSLARQYDPDIIFSHGGATAYKERLIAKLLDKKFVMRLGGHIYEEYRENTRNRGIRELANRPVYKTHYWFMFANLRAADHIIVVTKDMKQRYCAESGRNPDTVSVVPVPCDPKRFDLPKTIAFPQERILCVTNLNFKPKLQAILDFLPVLEEYGATIIAPGRYHEVLAKRTQLPVLGFVKDIEQEYQQASILCYFSYLDGCPNVVLEAWASRTPVIANRCSWSEELIQDRWTGLLVSDAGEAETAIRTLLSDHQMGKTLAENGYRYLSTHHTEEVAGRRLGEVMQGVVCGS